MSVGCLFGMGSVYAADLGMSNVEISIFIGAIYLGGLIFQIPIGWFSDRMDRRVLIAGVTLCAAVASLFASLAGGFLFLTLLAFVIGGMANPLYSLLAAYVNDQLEHEDMASAAGGLILINGVGALTAPIVVGFAMENVGPAGFFLVIATAMGLTFVYSLWRMTQRPSTPVDETGPMVAMSPVVSQVATDAAWEAALEDAQEAADSEEAPVAAG
ncbi:MAG: MFS transporter [Pseudomonadota bacterium]